MTIKQNGGVFGRNPTFNDVTIEGDLILNGETFTGLDFNGSWNASTNSPTLSSGTGTQGEFYIVSVAGTTNLDGVTNWGVGDYCFFNGTAWQRIEGGADGNFVNASVSGTLTSSNVTNASGDITLDASGDITLDADGADIRFKDGGSTIALAKMDSSNFTIQTNNNDKDIIFNGYDSDGGGLITALTLDMSDKGTAIFNNKVRTQTLLQSIGADTQTNVTASQSIGIHLQNTSNTDGNFVPIDFYNSTDFVTARIGAEFQDAGDRNTDLYFATRANSGSLTEKARITSEGKIRLGNSGDHVMIDLTASNAAIELIDNNQTNPPTLRGNGPNFTIENGGLEMMRISSTTATIFNEASQNIDFRVESDTNTHAFFVDAGNSRVGIMHNSPSKTFDVQGTGRFGIGVSQNTEVLLDAYDNTTNSDIAGLVGGSTFGALIQGGFAGHCVVGLRENDVGDSFSIVSGGGNFTTDSTYDLLCFQVESDGDVSIPNGNLIVKDSGIVGTFNRLSSDGLVLKIEKDNAGIGGLGAAASSIYLQGSSNGGIYINGQTDVRPWNTSTLANLDNSMDLGSSTARFKDLYLSNNLILNSVKLGGGSATVADDAVGSFTPPKKAGIAIMCAGAENAFPAGESFTAMFYYDVGTSLSANELSIGIGGDVAVTSSDVTGTTGTDGDITIGLTADTVKVENRIGGAQNIQLTFL